MGIRSHDPSVTWSREVTGKLKCCIFTSTRPMVTKLYKAVPQDDRTPTKKSYDSFSKCSFDVTQEIKTGISLLSQDL